MATRRRQPADRAIRPPMRSPGRPPGWRREHRQRFWEGIAGRVVERGSQHGNRIVSCRRNALVP